MLITKYLLVIHRLIWLDLVHVPSDLRPIYPLPQLFISTPPPFHLPLGFELCDADAPSLSTRQGHLVQPLDKTGGVQLCGPQPA